MLNSRAQNLQLKLGNYGNLSGIKLKFKLDGDKARTEFVFNEYHQRLSGEIHRGVIAILIDAGIGWIARNGARVSSVTAKMEIEFLKPAAVGEPLVMIVQIEKNKRKILEQIAQIERPDGTQLVKARCLQYIIKDFDPEKEKAPRPGNE
jgi:acyl-CoA thioesterase FadM